MGRHASGCHDGGDFAGQALQKRHAESNFLPPPAGCPEYAVCHNAPMQIIPVIDLLQGQVVRGVGGRRDEYRPIVSSLVASADPGEVATAIQQRFQLPRIYVADLDAITGGNRDVAAWRAIAAAGWALTIDAGLRTAAEIADLWRLLDRDFVAAEFVIGLESLRSLAELGELHRCGEPVLQNGVFSLDLKAGVPLTLDAQWRSASALELMSEVYRCGMRRTIVLDLADVGSGAGTSTLPLVRQLHEQFPELEIIAGGGVRGLDDLRQLKAAGATAALVASALHDGRLTLQDLYSLSDT
jgi:phosphoribosylformimino-5-aminoimidazole carboxamide ribotide isomerase